MKLFGKHFKFKYKSEHVVLIVGAVLIALRLFFPVLQCRTMTEDRAQCPRGLVSFFSVAPNPNYEFHKERTYTEATALGILTLALYFVSKRNKSFFGN